MNHNEAEVIAAAVAIIRPDWLQSSMVKLLAKQRHRPARQVALALVSMAYDPEVKSPGLLNTEGGALAHWAVGQIGEPTYVPPANHDIACRVHLDRDPCRGCAADAKAGSDRTPTRTEPNPITDVETIRLIRAAEMFDNAITPEGEAVRDAGRAILDALNDRCPSNVTLRDEEHRLCRCYLTRGHQGDHNDGGGVMWTGE